MENNAQTKDKSLALWIALLVALFLSVVGIFALLRVIAPTSWEAQIWDTMNTEKTVGGNYQMRMLDEQERKADYIGEWLNSAQEQVSGENAAEHSAFWLYVQEEDYYVLYLPHQDRTLGLTDITVSEETEAGGTENTLVIRARTSEKSEPIIPEEQLFVIKTDSETWRGIRISVILDGREKDMYKLVYANGQLLSTEEVYIGRY